MEEVKPEYFYRLICLVVDLGTEVLLKVFKHEINVSNKVSIEGFLKSKESKIKGLKKGKILNDKQIETLNQTNFDETKLDISLLYTLLRNLTDIQEPNTGWDAHLLPSDESPGALLTRLKNVRNDAIAHSAKGSLNKSEFEKFWKEASFCLVGLAGGIGPNEEKAVQKKVDHCKTQPLLGDEIEKSKLDALWNWYLEENCPELKSKVDTLTDQVDKQESRGQNNEKDISELKKDFSELKKDISELKEENEGRKGIELKREMEGYFAGIIKKLQAKQVLPPEDPITNPHALTPDDILKYSKEIGADWKLFARYLGFTTDQIDILAETHRKMSDIIRKMLHNWHEVVARLDENPKELLAGAFLRHDDYLTPKEILGNNTINEDEVREYKPSKETRKQIENINFDDNPHQTPYNIGQQVGHQQAQSSISLGAGYGHTTPYSDNPHNMCRGLYKKIKDDTLSQSVLGTLNECMKIVGCLVVRSFGGTRGTVFRAGDRYVITASHVLDRITDKMYGEYLPSNDPSDRAPAVFINFNENPSFPPSTLYTVKPPCFFDRQLDIAILEISNPDNFLPCFLPLSKTDGPNSSVSCIGYGHPGSDAKHLDPTCCVLTANSERVQQCLITYWKDIEIIKRGLKQNDLDPERGNEAFTGYDDQSCFLLDSFFEHGGSGSPAIDHSNSYSPMVVGIYTRGFPSILFDLPDNLRHSYKKEYRFEMCTKTSSLYGTLVSQNQELAHNIFG